MPVFSSHSSSRDRRSSVFAPLDARDILQGGFTLVEAVMAAAVLAVVAILSINLFNSIIAYINKTDQLAKYNLMIDNDISRIKQAAQAYNACASPTGTVSTSGCGVYGEANAYYYFPDPANSADVSSFETACSSTSASTTPHITAAFIDLIKPQIDAKISKSVQREDAANAENNNIVVTYTGPGGISRTIVVSPFLSFWCS